MKTNTTQNKVQAQSTINNATQTNKVQTTTNTKNNGATIYKVFDIQNNLCMVKYNGVEYKGKLLNTSPTTHLKFDKYDILVPATITLDNGVQVYTKTTQYNGADNQTKFKQFLNLIQNKVFTFDKSTQAKTTTRNNTTKANVLEYINSNEKLKNEYTTLKQQFDKAKQQFDNAKTMFDAFIQAQTTNATQKQAKNTVEQLLQSGLITIEQLQAITQKQRGAK